MRMLPVSCLSSGVSLARGEKPACFSSIIKPVTIWDESVVMGTVCPYTPAHLTSIGKAEKCGHPRGSPGEGGLAPLFPVSIWSHARFGSCLQSPFALLLSGFFLPCFSFCWREAYMKISTWGWNFMENAHPCRQLNLDVLAQFFGRNGVWLPPLPIPISLARAFLDNELSGEWNDSTKDGWLQELFLS